MEYERRPALAAIPHEVLADILDEAILASAITCTRRGADPPSYSELTSSSLAGRPH